MIGTCPFCGVPPPAGQVIGETDILYRCPVCDFPQETFAILAFLDKFDQQIEVQCQQIDLMLEKREQLIR